MIPAPLSNHPRRILDQGGAELLAKVAPDVQRDALTDLEIYLRATPKWDDPEHRQTFDALMTEAYQAFYTEKDYPASARMIQALAAHAKACGPSN